VVIEWIAQAGRTYQLECKDSLNQPTWTILGQITATGGTASFTNAPQPTISQRYYRVSQ